MVRPDPAGQAGRIGPETYHLATATITNPEKGPIRIGTQLDYRSAMLISHYQDRAGRVRPHSKAGRLVAGLPGVGSTGRGNLTALDLLPRSVERADAALGLKSDIPHHFQVLIVDVAFRGAIDTRIIIVTGGEDAIPVGVKTAGMVKADLEIHPIPRVIVPFPYENPDQGSHRPIIDPEFSKITRKGDAAIVLRAATN